MTLPRLIRFGLLAAISFSLVGCSTAEKPRLNVLVVVVDTLRADYLGNDGFDGDISPRIDALARRSVVFDHCIAPAPWTPPSVASMITSLHPQNHCVYGDRAFCGHSDGDEGWAVLSDEATTLAEVLHDNGYETAGFVGNFVLKAKFGFAQGFDLYAEPWGSALRIWRAEQREFFDQLEQEEPEMHVEHDRHLFRMAIDWMSTRDASQPYFLYLHLMDAHTPYRSTEEDLEALRRAPGLGESRSLSPAEMEWHPGKMELDEGIPIDEASTDLRDWRWVYGGGVRGVDRNVGDFLEIAEQSGWLENTLVLFTSDHGEEFLEHGEWEHGLTFYNEALRVPLIIHLPGQAEERRVEETVNLIDVMPTLLSLAGVESDVPMQGVDLSDRVRGGRPADDRWTFSSAGLANLEQPSIAVQNVRHKLILEPTENRMELYDLAEDPKEQNDLSASRPDLSARLRAEIDRHLSELADYDSYRSGSAPLSEEEREKLRSLGYLN